MRDELRERLDLIEVVAERFDGVRESEHLLVDLTALLRSKVMERSDAVSGPIGWAAS